jgi:hypothetical protein
MPGATELRRVVAAALRPVSVSPPYVLRVRR